MDPQVWSRLPSELLEKIQLKLPVLDIIRFRNVSKSWNALSWSKAFSEEHSTVHKFCCYENMFLLSSDAVPKCSFQGALPFLEVRNEFQLWLLDCKKNFYSLPTPGLDDIPMNYCFRYLRGACGGLTLILAFDDSFHGSSYFIWNPQSRSCESIGIPKLWVVILDGIVLDEVTRQFVVIIVGKSSQEDKAVTWVFDSNQWEVGWFSVDSNFPVEKFNRIRGPLACTKELCCCSWLIEDATTNEQRYVSSYFIADKRWEHNSVEKEVEWIQAPMCGTYKPIMSGLKRNNFVAVTQAGSGTCMCVLSGTRKVYLKMESVSRWISVVPSSVSNLMSNLLAFNLVLTPLNKDGVNIKLD